MQKKLPGSRSKIPTESVRLNCCAAMTAWTTTVAFQNMCFWDTCDRFDNHLNERYSHEVDTWG